MLYFNLWPSKVNFPTCGITPCWNIVLVPGESIDWHYTEISNFPPFLCPLGQVIGGPDVAVCVYVCLQTFKLSITFTSTCICSEFSVYIWCEKFLGHFWMTSLLTTFWPLTFDPMTWDMMFHKPILFNSVPEQKFCSSQLKDR